MIQSFYKIFRLSLLVSALLAPFSVSGELLMRTSFENTPTGTPFTRDLWTADGFKTDIWDNGLSTRTSICSEAAANGSKSMRVMYPKDEYGPENSGCQVVLQFDQRGEAYMSYYLMFSENFSWGTTEYGGKLPGLAGGDRCSGGETCDGTNGWSARFMWRTGGKIVLYLYDMLKTQTYGVDYQLTYPDGSPVVATPGQWLHITERVKANSSPDSADGEVQAWVNGQEVLLLTGRKFTSNGEQVDNLYISTFHGGSTSDWCPTDTCYTYFDDICIGTEYNDVKYPDCHKPDLGADQTLCNASGKVTLEAGSTMANYHLTWFNNGEKLAESSSLTTSTPGTYILMADSERCALTDTVVVSDLLSPQLGGEKLICQSSFQLLDCGIKAADGLSFSWKKDGEFLPGENQPVLFVKDAGDYTVIVSSEFCKTAESHVKVTSGLLPIADVTFTDGTAVDLEVAQTGNYIWTNQDGDTLGTGNPVTLIPSATDNYIYVKDADGFDGNVGKNALTENAWTRDNYSTEFMEFTVKRDLTIDSISIYPTKLLDATLHIVDESTGDVVFSQTYSQLASGVEQRLPIGVTLGSGNYHIDADGTTEKLYHSHTDADIQFPYSIDGLIEITGCNVDWINTKGWYLFFYKWHVSAGNHCAAAPVRLLRTTVNTIISPQSNPHVIQTSNQLSVSGLTPGFHLTLYNAQGRIVASQKSGSEVATIATSFFPKGVYMLIIEGENKSSFKLIIE